MGENESQESRKIAIIGLGTGGLYSSRAATRFDRKVEITVVERREYDMFSPCGLPYAIEGIVGSFEDLKHSVPSTRQLKKLLKHEALSINIESKRVQVENLETGENQSDIAEIVRAVRNNHIDGYHLPRFSLRSNVTFMCMMRNTRATHTVMIRTLMSSNGICAGIATLKYP